MPAELKERYMDRVIDVAGVHPQSYYSQLFCVNKVLLSNFQLYKDRYALKVVETHLFRIMMFRSNDSIQRVFW